MFIVWRISVLWHKVHYRGCSHCPLVWCRQYWYLRIRCEDLSSQATNATNVGSQLGGICTSFAPTGKVLGGSQVFPASLCPPQCVRVHRRDVFTSVIWKYSKCSPTITKCRNVRLLQTLLYDNVWDLLGLYQKYVFQDTSAGNLFSSLWFYGPLDLGRFFSSLILYTDGRTPWASDQSVARPLPTHRTTQTQNKRIQISMPRVGFEPTIPVFELAKTVYALSHTATVIGSKELQLLFKLLIKFYSDSETPKWQ
jgi:hypothetical protein